MVILPAMANETAESDNHIDFTNMIADTIPNALNLKIKYLPEKRDKFLRSGKKNTFSIIIF